MAKRKYWDLAGSRKRIMSGYNALNYGYRAYKRMRGGVPTKPRQRYFNGQPTTFQSQYTTDFVKRKVSRKTKRRARRKYKAFKRNLYKQVGCQHIVFRHQTRESSAENQQQWFDIPLYSANGGQEGTQPAALRFQHLEQIADDMVTGGTSVLERYGMIRSTYAQMDLQMTNRGTETMQINLYYYYAKKDLSRADAISDNVSAANADTIVGLMSQVRSLLFPSEAGTTNLQINDIGFTPFQSPRFCQYLTVYKKQRFQLAPGQSMTDMLKDKRIKEWTQIGVNDFVALKGYTSGVLIGFHSLYNGEADGGGETSYPAATLDWSTQYTYNAKLLERRLDTAVHNVTGL